MGLFAAAHGLGRSQIDRGGVILVEPSAAADSGRDPGFSAFDGAVRGRRCRAGVRPLVESNASVKGYIVVNSRVYGCSGGSIEAVAETIQQALNIVMHSIFSPMDGPWYDSTVLEPLARALEAGDMDTVRRLGAQRPSYPAANLMLNDLDPVRRPYYPTEDTYVIRVEGDEADLNRLEQALCDAGHKPRRLG